MKTYRVFLCLAFHFAFHTSQAHLYYVSPSGNNANPGTLERPWASPGYGSRQLSPGDTMVILGGRYVLSEYDADIITPASGTAGAWITIRGEEGRRPILAGRDNLLTAVNLNGVQYVRIENLEITHDDQAAGESLWFREGVEILAAPSAHIVLRDLYIHHLDEFGMNIQDVEDLHILDCRLEYCGFGALGGPAGEQGGWRNVTIRGCSLSYSGHYYQGGDGSNRPYDRPDGFGIEPSAGPILIENTVSEHNYGDGLDSKSANTTIRQCIVANNSCDGVKLWGPNSRIENTLIYGRGDGNPEPTPWAAIVIAPEEQRNAHFEILNVTVDDFLGHNYLMYVQYDHPDVPAHVTIRNTIFSGRGPECPIYVNGASTLIADHNLFYLPQNETLLIHGESTYTCDKIGSLGEGNLCSDPLFVKPAWGEEGDYHLREGSPAINTGTTFEAPTIDLENRPRDAQPDMGAYEFGSAVGIHLDSEMFGQGISLFQNYPNPFNPSTTIRFTLTPSLSRGERGADGKVRVTLKVFDALGKEVATLVDGELTAGEHSMIWDGIDDSGKKVVTGLYFCTLKVGNSVKTKKLLILR